jgi:hypothetical protein
VVDESGCCVHCGVDRSRGSEYLTDAELIELDRLLSKSLGSSLAAGLVPTRKGRGRSRYGADLRHALDAVEAEEERRGLEPDRLR